ACRMRSATPRRASAANSSRTERYLPPCSTYIALTLAVAIQTDSRAWASLSSTTSRYSSLPASSAATIGRGWATLLPAPDDLDAAAVVEAAVGGIRVVRVVF